MDKHLTLHYSNGQVAYHLNFNIELISEQEIIRIWKGIEVYGAEGIFLTLDDGCASGFTQDWKDTLILCNTLRHLSSCGGVLAAQHFAQDGELLFAAHCDSGLLHNVNGWARIEYDYTGDLSRIEYWIRGLLHNICGASVIVYDGNGRVIDCSYYLKGENIKADWFKELGMDIEKDFTDEISRNMVLFRYANHFS